MRTAYAVHVPGTVFWSQYRCEADAFLAGCVVLFARSVWTFIVVRSTGSSPIRSRKVSREACGLRSWSSTSAPHRGSDRRAERRPSGRSVACSSSF